MHFTIGKERENANNKAAAKHKSYFWANTSTGMYVNLIKNGFIRPLKIAWTPQILKVPYEGRYGLDQAKKFRIRPVITAPTISSGSLKPYEPIGSLNLKLWKFALRVVPDRTSDVS